MSEISEKARENGFDTGFFKKIKKSLKKGLTNENYCSIIVKHNCEGELFRRASCSLKIEQHEISSTEKCEISLKKHFEKRNSKSKKVKKRIFLKNDY